MRIRTGFITGHSVPGCTGLSTVQRAFQEKSALPPDIWIPHNFPWRETFPFPEPVGILRASCNNASHYFASRKKDFQANHQAEVSEIFSGCDRLILLAGSCGLELLDNLSLSKEQRSRLHVFAYGPVSRRRPDFASLLTVQGEGDRISRFFHRNANKLVPCGHTNYLESPEVLDFFHEFYEEAIRT